jgi:hypothetical protein
MRYGPSIEPGVKRRPGPSIAAAIPAQTVVQHDGFRILYEQRFHLAAQVVIAAARLAQKPFARGRGKLQRGVIEVLDAPPSLGGHQPRDPSSRASHALANFQSRRTLAAEMLSTFAISSALRPPKKRISITLALRGSGVPDAGPRQERSIRRLDPPRPPFFVEFGALCRTALHQPRARAASAERAH